ncbi:MAG TPA: LytTR family DNA-binding domain-containing protein [Bacteroidales bacterium]|nr:LytTR family DNA-binding domain-containing protein [Bacteroidales bacterium]
MKIRAIIVDDEPDARESIRLLCNEFYNNEIEIVDSAGTTKDAVRVINIRKPDLVFLDIEMPCEDGFKLFEYFGKEYDFHVIFITAYQKYAISAFRYAALDYLLKPVDYKLLGEAINRASENPKNTNRLKLDTFINNLSHNLEINKKLLLPSRNGYHVVKVNSINFCKADGNYSIVNMIDEKSFTVASTLKTLEELLPETCFFRTHKSFLVNLNYAKSFDKIRSILTLENGREVEVSTRRVFDLENTLKSF